MVPCCSTPPCCYTCCALWQGCPSPSRGLSAWLILSPATRCLMFYLSFESFPNHLNKLFSASPVTIPSVTFLLFPLHLPTHDISQRFCGVLKLSFCLPPLGSSLKTVSSDNSIASSLGEKDLQ